MERKSGKKQSEEERKYLDVCRDNYQYFKKCSEYMQELLDVKCRQEDTYVCQRRNLRDILKTIIDNTETLMTEEQADSLYERLKPLTEITDEEKRQHIASISRKMNDKEHYPCCGGKLVERTARKGPNAGRRFLGCENYPKCRFTTSIND